MTVRVLIGDMFESSAQTWVNTVNCVGVMGKGIALGFKKRFPDMYADYVARCQSGEVRLGEPYIYKGRLDHWIINFPTKQDWRSVAKLSDITVGMNYLKRHIEEWDVTSLAVPPLGCGEGKLEWRIVGRILYAHLSQLSLPVALYAPRGTPADALTAEYLTSPAAGLSQYRQRLEPSAVALAEVLWRIGKTPYHHPIGHVSFQKIGYFATALGLPSRVTFDRSSYGPFSDELKGWLSMLVNNGLVREDKQGNLLRLRAEAGHLQAREQYGLELLQFEEVIGKVTDLALRLTGRELEIAATAHYVAQHLRFDGRRPAEAEVMAAVQQWKARRRPPFTDEEIALSIRTLNLQGLVDLTISEDLPLPDTLVA